MRGLGFWRGVNLCLKFLHEIGSRIQGSHLPHGQDGPQARGYEPDDVHDGHVVLGVDQQRGQARPQDDTHRVGHPDEDGGQGSLVVPEPELESNPGLLVASGCQTMNLRS